VLDDKTVSEIRNALPQKKVLRMKYPYPNGKNTNLRVQRTRVETVLREKYIRNSIATFASKRVLFKSDFALYVL
jgi:hypothetical protein